MDETAFSGAVYPGASLLPASARDRATPHAHSVQFYDEDHFLLSELGRLIGSALGAGDAAIVIATRDHRDGLAQRLKARSLDVDAAASAGRYVALDALETMARFMSAGQPDPARFEEVVGDIISRAAASTTSERSRVVVFGEMVVLAWAQGLPEAAMQLERLWNDLAGRYSFELLCAYPMSLFADSGDQGAIAGICSEHSSVIPTESYTSLTGEEERLRAITLLQQKAQALEKEVEQRKETEQTLQERNQELRAAVAARDNFLSVAAHELKTPVTSLRGFAQLLLRDARTKGEISPQRLEVALRAIESQTGKLTSLVGRLLDSAQIEAGKLRIEPETTDLVALVGSALARQQGAAARHTFVFNSPERLEARVDPIRFEQVVIHLLDNAVKFSPGGGIIEVELARGAGGGLRLSVTDHGVGVPQAHRAAIFDRLHQAHSERHLSGMGIGLYVSRQIVQLHGGSLEYEQPDHAGSRFVVVLPPSPVTGSSDAKNEV